MKKQHKHRRFFILDGRTYSILKGKKKLRRCQKCGKNFKIGEKVLSIPYKHAKWVCVECAKKYNIWVSK